MSKDRSFITIMNKNNETTFEYIGYYQMLDKIITLMDKVSYDDKKFLICSYIDILQIIKTIKQKEPK